MITVHLATEESLQAELARVLKRCALTLHGGPVQLAFVHPDGTREDYSLWVGKDDEDWRNKTLHLNRSKH